MADTNTPDGEGVKEVFLSQGFGNNTVAILMASWRKDTSSNYSYTRENGLNLHLVTSFHQLNRQIRLH